MSMSIGEQITAKRKAAKLSQQALAAAMSEKLGRTFSQVVLSRLENGQRNLKLDEQDVLVELIGFTPPELEVAATGQGLLIDGRVERLTTKANIIAALKSVLESFDVVVDGELVAERLDKALRFLGVDMEFWVNSESMLHTINLTDLTLPQDTPQILVTWQEVQDAFKENND